MMIPKEKTSDGSPTPEFRRISGAWYIGVPAPSCSSAPNTIVISEKFRLQKRHQGHEHGDHPKKGKSARTSRYKVALYHTSKAEIDELHRLGVVCCQHAVAGLEISVHDALGVHILHGADPSTRQQKATPFSAVHARRSVSHTPARSRLNTQAMFCTIVCPNVTTARSDLPGNAAGEGEGAVKGYSF